MINVEKISLETPFKIFLGFLNKASKKDQKNIDAFMIASYSTSSQEVDSRYVNLKFVLGEDFIFFSNYFSKKAYQFQEHPKVSTALYWPSINVQIRMKGNISKTSRSFNEEYFKTRSLKKNALAISSSQSSEIDSYEEVKEKYEHVYINEDLKECPQYWGGYKFRPNYFEFWEGKENRINKRSVFRKEKDKWDTAILQP